MGFYDSVKDDIREENGDGREEQPAGQDEDNDTMPFDHLKKGAEDEGDDEGSSGSDTEIEVLTEDGIKPAEGSADTASQQEESQGPREDAQQQRDREPSGAAQDRSETAGGTGAAQADAVESAGGTHASGVDTSSDELVETLQRIEQQNSEMLDVLRGIKRSLDGA